MAGAKKKTTPALPLIGPVASPAPAAPIQAEKIKFLRRHHGYAYWPGDEVALSPEHHDLLIAGGFAELVKPAA